MCLLLPQRVEDLHTDDGDGEALTGRRTLRFVVEIMLRYYFRASTVAKAAKPDATAEARAGESRF